MRISLHNYSGSWFAVHVRPKAEHFVTAVLTGKGYECFLPTYMAKRSWSDRLKNAARPLFPGYTFCRIDSKPHARIVSTPGVIRLVGYGTVPTPVEDKEITALQTAMRSGASVAPWPRLEIGETVRITSGPLCGVEGVLRSFNKREHFVVSVSLLQRSALVELKPEWVTSATRT